MRRALVVILCAGAALFSMASPVWAIGVGGWSRLGHGSTTSLPALNGAVYAMSTANPSFLLVGGNFTAAGGHAGADRIAKWDGTSWSALGSAAIANGAVFAITAHDSRVFAGGTFLDAGGNANADHLAVWNGTSWAPFCTNTGQGATFTGNVQALQIVGNTLYVGGSFQNGAGIDAADYLMACDLTTGTASPVVDSLAHSFNASVVALAADSNGVLYAGGQFINLGGDAFADHVAVYAGGGIWQAMGSGVDSFVRALTTHGTDLYVGTDSVNVGGIAFADHIARWNGAAWSAVGHNAAGLDGWLPASGFVYSIAVYGSLVIVGGSFQNADGVAAADQIAYFDGSTWRAIGSDGAGNGPVGSSVSVVATQNGRAYAGGAFTSAGGDTLASYAAAYFLRLADARIGKGLTGPWTGNAVYSSTAVGESTSQSIPRGASGNFYVSVQNDGLTSASYTLHGTGAATGYTVNYFDGATNITTAVRAGTYLTSSIPARSSITIRLKVALSASATGSAPFFTVVMNGSVQADAVKAIAISQ